MINERGVEGVTSPVALTSTSNATPPLTFKLPFPPSMNSLYGINFKTRSVYMMNDARYWKSKAKLMIPKFNVQNDTKICMKMYIFSEWYFKNGKQKKHDVHNLIKIVADAISEKCGFDDSQIWSFSANKVQSTEQSVQVTMGVLNEAYGETWNEEQTGTITTNKGVEEHKQNA